MLFFLHYVVKLDLISNCLSLYSFGVYRANQKECGWYGNVPAFFGGHNASHPVGVSPHKLAHHAGGDIYTNFALVASLLVRFIQNVTLVCLSSAIKLLLYLIVTALQKFRSSLVHNINSFKNT